VPGAVAVERSAIWPKAVFSNLAEGCVQAGGTIRALALPLRTLAPLKTIFFRADGSYSKIHFLTFLLRRCIVAM
jgi:hypothetical protein